MLLLIKCLPVRVVSDSAVAQLRQHALYYCFILIIFTDVYCHVFITTRVTLELKSPAIGIVLRILYTPMLTATAQQPGVQGWALKATSFRRTRQLMVNHFVVF